MGCSLRESFQRSCRLCAEEQEVTVVMFSREAEPLLLQNKINKYLLIEVDENDALPKNICIRCCNRLHTVCEFIDNARRAQEVLLSRSILLGQIKAEEQTQSFNENSEVTIEPECLFDNDSNVTQMEICVDPMMVLQNCEGVEFLDTEDNGRCYTEPVTYLHGLESENVTIKLIRKCDNLDMDQKPEAMPEFKNDIVLIDVSSKVIDKPFPCVVCKRSFLTELALKNHSWIHYNEDKGLQVYKCTSCEDSFEYKSDLLAHLKEHKNSVTCAICGRVFRTPENLAVHMQTHISPCLAYICKICGRAYNTSSNLKTHSITHSNDRPYNCHLCKKSFKRNQDLKFHINQHTGAKPYKCPFCDKSFASSGNCYSHRNRMHPGKKQLPKPTTGKRTRNKTPLQVNGQPSGPPPQPCNKGTFKHQCQVCGHGFMKRDNFTYHMYQHTGEKPFQCSLCPDKFVTRKGWLIHHDRKHREHERPLSLLSKNNLLK